MFTKIEHNSTKYITCPYCGYEEQDSWERNDDDGSFFDCKVCGEKQRLYVETTVAYSTSKVKEVNCTSCNEDGKYEYIKDVFCVCPNCNGTKRKWEDVYED